MWSTNDYRVNNQMRDSEDDMFLNFLFSFVLVLRSELYYGVENSLENPKEKEEQEKQEQE
jgi:hypothetical protein